MSILGFTGLPGSGKSYGVVQNVIVPALERGRAVCTNIPLHMDEIKKSFPESRVTQIDNIEDFSNGTLSFINDVPHGAICVFDEIWRIWPAGTKANEAQQDHKQFLAEHRHLVGEDGKTTEIVLVSQDLAQIANFARILIEKTYIVTKLTAVGAKSKYRVDIFARAVCGPKGPESQRLGQIFGTYSSDVWKYYQSHTQAEEGVVGNEEEADHRGVVWRRPIILLGFPIAILGLVYGGYSIISIFTGISDDSIVVSASQKEDISPYTIKKSAKPITAPEPEPVVIPVREVELKPYQWPSQVDLSSRWRIGAFVETTGKDDGVVLLVDSVGKSSFKLNVNKHCKILSASIHQFECFYEGERITSYSGGRGSSQPGIFAKAASSLPNLSSFGGGGQ